MPKKFSILGHPLHPPFTHFPIAFWSISLLWDLLGILRHGAIWWQLSFWCLGVGLALSLITMTTGFLDYVAHSEERSFPFRTANRHIYTVVLSASAYLGSLLVRGGPDAPSESRLWVAVVLSALGLVLVQLGGWLGGELVFRHGIGVQQKTLEEKP